MCISYMDFKKRQAKGILIHIRGFNISYKNFLNYLITLQKDSNVKIMRFKCPNCNYMNPTTLGINSKCLKCNSRFFFTKRSIQRKIAFQNKKHKLLKKLNQCVIENNKQHKIYNETNNKQALINSEISFKESEIITNELVRIHKIYRGVE